MTIASGFGLVKNRIMRLNKKMSLIEKSVIYLALLFFIIGIIGLSINRQIPTSTQAQPGGELIEGIVATNSASIDKEIENLTNIGLFKFSSTGEIIPAVADHYDISGDGKLYTIYLKKGIDPQIVTTVLKDSENGIGGGEVNYVDDRVSIKLASPYAPLIANLTRANLPYGPYKVVKRDNKQISFTKTENFILGNIYIPTVKLIVYQDKTSLVNALKRGEVMAGSNIDFDNPNFNQFQLTLQKYQVLFFNLDRPIVKDVSLRQKIAKSEMINPAITLVVTTIDNETQLKVLNDFKQKMQPLGLNIETKIVDESTLRADILAKRNFDALLYGIDFGRDPDPYLFWHSSQIGNDGQNISGFRSRKADKILEEGLTTLNLDERKKKYQNLQTILDQEVPAIFLDQTKVNYYLNNKIKGVEVGLGVTNSDRFNNIWQWYIRTKKVPIKN